MNPITCNRPRALLAFVLACLVFAALALTISSCKSDDVLLPEEKSRVDQLDTQAKDQAARMKAAEQEAKAAAEDFAAAMKTGDAAAQSAALARFNAARADWKVLVGVLQATINEQDEILSEAQRRAATPIAESAKLLGVPSPLVEIGIALGLPLLFDRSRKHLRDTIVNAAKLNFSEALLGPLRAVGLLHSSYDPRTLLEAAAKQARDKGNLALEAQIRATLGTLPTLSVPANATDGAAVVAAT